MAEWECAARWQGNDDSYGAIERGGTYWTPGNYASGAVDDYTNVEATLAAARFGTWFDQRYPELERSEVGQKPAGGNALGLYDLSGNVSEWVFDSSSLYRSNSIGGDYYSSSVKEVKIGYLSNSSDDDPDSATYHKGFRLARN